MIYKRYWGRILISSALQWLAAASIFALLPLVTKNILNTATQTKYIPISLFIYFVALQVLIPLGFRSSHLIMLRFEPLMKHDMANYLLDHLQQNSFRFFQNQFSGNLASKLQDVLINGTQLLETILADFLFSFFGVVPAFLAMLSAHIFFSIFLCIWVVAFFSIPLLSLPKAIRLSRILSESGAQIVGQTVDIISNLLTVKMFVGYGREQVLFRKQQRELTKASYDTDYFLWWVNFWQATSFCIYTVTSLAALIFFYAKNQVTTGDFALVLGINGSLIPVLWNTAEKIRQVIKKYSSVKQAISILLQPPEIVDAIDAKPLTVRQGIILFNDVWFSHDTQEDEKWLFKDLSIQIEGKQKVGLVGYSGGGKTTFTNLILRLFDIQKGKIFIDGQNIQGVTQDSLRAQISLIPQEPNLFHRSLMENIRYGNPDASDTDVIKAAKKAQIHDFIMQLPEGYNTEVGERGLKLSGGQRQRIAIARALLKDAPIVIMDEATSQLDSITEKFIQEDVFKFIDGKTVIVIAHRLSTLQQMDRLLVFEKGKIVQDGTHKDLLNQKGLYQNLWNTQQQINTQNM